MLSRLRGHLLRSSISAGTRDWVHVCKARVGKNLRVGTTRVEAVISWSEPHVSGKQEGCELVSQGWLIQVALTWGLGTTETHLLTILKAGSQKSRHPQGHAPCVSEWSSPFPPAGIQGYLSILHVLYSCIGPVFALLITWVFPLSLCLPVTCLPSHKAISHVPRAPH